MNHYVGLGICVAVGLLHILFPRTVSRLRPWFRPPRPVFIQLVGCTLILVGLYLFLPLR